MAMIAGWQNAHPASRGWRMAMWGGFAVLLLVPLLAMQLTSEVNWTALDFGAAAVLLGATGLGYELLARLRLRAGYRMVQGLAIAAALLLIWAQLAVGIF